ncbi:MAG: hypothetical protein J6386_20780 [Candidatus Synoicihabitans palmerolidicus]|nr:hypothetical protein [Candidatus Synoicihabitans palmerolidicus]
MDGKLPESESQGLVAAVRFGEGTQMGHGAAELLGGGADAEAVLTGDVGRVAGGAELEDEVGREDGGGHARGAGGRWP